MGKRRWSVLVDLVREHQWTRGVEVGVLAGETFSQLLQQCKGLHMIAVDPLTPQPLTVFSDDGTIYRNHNWLDYQHTMSTILDRYKLRASWIRLRSVEAAATIADSSQDFVFIDADHSSEAVRQDVMAWVPKIRSGGWLTGHDTHFPTVKRVLDEWLPGWQEYDDHVWSIPIEAINADRFVL